MINLHPRNKNWMGKLYRAQEILDCLSISIKLDFYTDLFYFPYVFYIFVWWDENISQSLSSVSMMQSFRWHRFYCWISSEPITRIHLPIPEIWVQSLGQKIPRRTWEPTPVFLPGKSHGQRSLVGYSPRGHKESDMTEPLTLSLSFTYILSCVII